MAAGRVSDVVLAMLIMSQLCGCASSPGAATSSTQLACPHIPPPPPSKPPPKPANGASEILQPGHWEWNDGGYSWYAPQWRAQGAATWQKWHAGHWEPNGGACVWQNGRFAAAKP